MKKIDHKIECVISLLADEDELVSRLIKRGLTSGRSDESIEIIRHRQQIYWNQTSPLLNYYEDIDLLMNVNGVGEINDINNEIIKIVNNMLRVGLTGGIGSGKSTASNYLNELGAFVFDADNEAKKLLSTNDVVQHELISEFGTDIINPSGEIEKKTLSRIAFQDVDHQRRLNSVVHP